MPRGQAIKGVTVNASLFYSKYKDFIDYQISTTSSYGTTVIPVLGGNTYRTTNIADVEMYGTDLSAKFDLGEFFTGARVASAPRSHWVSTMASLVTPMAPPVV